MAAFLWRRGHDVQIVTRDAAGEDQSLAVDVDPSSITRTGYTDWDRVINPKHWLSMLPRGACRVLASTGSGTADIDRRSVYGRAGRLYRQLFLYPDKSVGWTLHLARALGRRCRNAPPDLILASGPPFSSFLAVAWQARRYRIPWCAEFRDRWMDDPYEDWPPWRRRFDHWFERRVLDGADGIVTVSDIWTRFYAAKYQKPVIDVMNGFDPRDFGHEREIPAAHTPLRIVYTGNIHAERRDPKALFQALRQDMLAPTDVIVEFFGQPSAYLEERIASCGVGDFVRCRQPVSYQESLQIQRDADILLLIQWNNEADNGNVPGKFFEYIASRRPILALGPVNGFPARTIRADKLGLHSNDPTAIEAWLRAQVATKRDRGAIADLNDDQIDRFNRDRQFSKLEHFLDQLVTASPADPSVPHVTPSLWPIETHDLDRPILTMIVDTESEFDWYGGFSRADDEVSAIPELSRLYEITRPFGVRPIHLIDHPVAKNGDAGVFLRRASDAGDCELGVQLHSWTTPPFEELVCARNSYGCNLPRDLQARKLAELVRIFEANFGTKPKVFKAGRYGIDSVGIDLLREHGFLVDTSMMPRTDLRREHGPNFMGCTSGPGWLDPQFEMLELPVTREVVGWAGAFFAPLLYSYTSRPWGEWLHLPGLLARSRVADRLTLTPEGMTLPELKRLTVALLRRGQRILTFSLHSPSLAVGNTPYVRTEDQRQAFLERIRAYLAFFHKELGGVSMTPLELHALLRRRSARSKAE